MTRKHFTAIAETIRSLDVDTETRQKVAEGFASTCAEFNGNFDRGRFIEAATKPTKG